MIVAEDMYKLGSQRSAIRELFEYGKKRAAEVGAENVYDFSLGNPTVPAPDCVNETVRELTHTLDSISLHGYTSAQGDAETRQAIADYLNKTYKTSFKADNFYMTMGAAASLSLCFKALTTSPEDEFITIAPFFPEYRVFVEANGANLVVVPPHTSDFQIDFDALEKAISKHTKGVIINSPNNPSGVVYSEETIKKLAVLLEKKSKENGHPVFIIADEPYREIAYDGVDVPYVTKYYDNTLVCYSYSKSLSLPGERIGFIATDNDIDDFNDVWAGLRGASGDLANVCAPTLFQMVVERCVDVAPNIADYVHNRQILREAFGKIGYTFADPSGAFYLFFKAPFGITAEEFMDLAIEHHVFVVPAGSFGCPEWLRLSFCVSRQTVEDSIPLFAKLYDEAKTLAEKK